MPQRIIIISQLVKRCLCFEQKFVKFTAVLVEAPIIYYSLVYIVFLNI